MISSFSSDDKRSVGLMGCVLFTIFCLLCIAQLYRLWALHRFDHGMFSDRNRPYLQIRFIAISFWAGLCDAMYFLLMMIHNQYTMLGYIFHLLAMCCFAVAFMVVGHRWSKVIRLPTDSFILRGFTYILLIWNVVVTCIAVTVALISNDYSKFIKHWSYEAVAFSNCCTLFVFCFGLFLYARHVRSKLIVSNSTVLTSERRGRDTLNHIHSFFYSNLEGDVNQNALVKKLFKMNMVLGFCSCCYFSRVVCLTFVLLDIVRHETSTDSISILLWFLLSSWVPSLGSGFVLLYTMRPKPKNQQNSRGHHDPRQVFFSSNMSCSSASTPSYLTEPSVDHSTCTMPSSDLDNDNDEGSNAQPTSSRYVPTFSYLSDEDDDDYSDIVSKFEASEQNERCREVSLNSDAFEHQAYLLQNY